MILDTNALSALADKDPALLERLSSARVLAVTYVTVGEYLFGILASKKRRELQSWLEAFLERAKILHCDHATLLHYAQIRDELKKVGKPIPANDCWIAALVRQHRMGILSKDRHFDHVAGIKRIEW